jgi:hypothetical protein
MKTLAILAALMTIFSTLPAVRASDGFGFSASGCQTWDDHNEKWVPVNSPNCLRAQAFHAAFANTPANVRERWLPVAICMYGRDKLIEIYGYAPASGQAEFKVSLVQDYGDAYEWLMPDIVLQDGDGRNWIEYYRKPRGIGTLAISHYDNYEFRVSASIPNPKNFSQTIISAYDDRYRCEVNRAWFKQAGKVLAF